MALLNKNPSVKKSLYSVNKFTYSIRKNQIQSEKKTSKLEQMRKVNETLKLVGIPMIVTTLTSMAGFISLLSMNTDSIWDLAIFSAVGILFAGLATWYVLPLILSNNVNVARRKKSTSKIDMASGLRKLVGIPSFIIVACFSASVIRFSKSI